MEHIPDSGLHLHEKFHSCGAFRDSTSAVTLCFGAQQPLKTASKRARGEVFPLPTPNVCDATNRTSVPMVFLIADALRIIGSRREKHTKTCQDTICRKGTERAMTGHQNMKEMMHESETGSQQGEKEKRKNEE